MKNESVTLVHIADQSWVPIARGVDMKVPHICEESGFWTSLVRFKPEGVLPRHWHLSTSEFYVLQGEGNHPQAGDFKPGDYFYEFNGAFHDEVTTNEEVILFMVSHGPSAFVGPDDSVQYVMDAGTTKLMLEQQGKLSKFFIFKAILRSAISRLIPLPPPFGKLQTEAAMRVQTEDLPWVSIVDGVDCRILHISETTGFWTTLFHFEAGSKLPRRLQLTAAESYVVKGSGHHPQVGKFQAGDYLYEHNGSFQDEISVDEEALFFRVNYGPWAFVAPDNSVQRILDAKTVSG